MTLRSKDIIPSSFKLRVDLLGKIMLTDKSVVNVVTKALVDQEDEYKAIGTGSTHEIKCDVMYVPLKNKDLPDIAIFIKDRNISDEKYISEVIVQCTAIYEKTHLLPICFIISTNRLNQIVKDNTTQCNHLCFLRELESTFWAERCFIMSRESIDEEQEGHPLLDMLNSLIIRDTLTL